MPRHPRSTRRNTLQHFHTALADALECRCLLSASELAQIPAVLAHPSDASQDDITLSDYLSDAETAQIITNLGEIDITFTPELTPLTVNDFAEYAANGLYDNTFFHRSAYFTNSSSTGEVGGSPANPANIVQGGGLVATAQTDSNGNTTYVPDQINTFAPIVDEADSSLSNLAGTIALARTSDPNSGTSEFYFNVTDNTEFDYDPTTDNPGYAVFGNVTSGMPIVDQIAALNTDSSLFGSYGYTEVPVTNTPPTVNDLVTITSVTVPSNCTYSATSSQPGLVRPLVNGDNLSFAYGNAIGSAIITVTATSTSTTDPTTASETFAVTVPPLPSSPLANVAGPIVSAQTYTFNNVLGQQDGPFYLLNSASDNTGTIDPTNQQTLSAYTLPTHGTLYNDGENDGGLTYVPDVGFTGTDFFEYTATDSNGVTSAPAIVSLVIDPAPTVATIGYQAAPSLHFVQPDGTVGVIRVTTGTAAITLTGTDPAVTRTAAGLFATGVNISNIALTNARNHYTSLVIQGFPGPHQGKIVVGGISDTTGNVFDLVGRTTELTGTSSFVGVTNVELDELDNATVNITKDVTGWKIQNAIDSSITGEGAFRQLRADSWTTDNVNNYYIEGLYITSMYISGNFDESLDINGEYSRHTIGLARITGTIGSTVPIPWYFNGTVGKIEARAVAPDTLSISSAGNPDPTGQYLYLNFLANLQLGGNVTGVGISAGAIGTISIGGNLTDSGIQTIFGYSPRVTQMQHINVGGNIVDSSIASVGNMGIVTATGMAQTIIAAGVNEGDLVLTGPLIDDSSSDLAAQASIASVRLGGRAPTFADSRIAAAHIGALTLGAITDDNSGTPLGISAESVAALHASLVSGGKLALGRAELSSAAALAAYFASHPYTLDDFAIDLFSASS